MINLLSYFGMNLQAELCLWTILGLLRTIFDATLFKVNANLIQVWQMTMPPELSVPVQRLLRTMISGVMLVQCFTVYVYLAAYIVLLYPIFLEERPTLVLPWLLLAAIRKFLCELTSLALGLGVCLLLGPARSQCIKFVVFKIASIIPAFYMWMLVISYYNTLKLATAFKTFPAVLQSSDHDYGLELAVRRRRTKSLLDEDQLRKKLVASLNYGDSHVVEEAPPMIYQPNYKQTLKEIPTRMIRSTDVTLEEITAEMELSLPLSSTSDRLISNVGSYEDWCGSEVIIPRDADRILEQFVLMLLRIGAFIKMEVNNPFEVFATTSPSKASPQPLGDIECTNITEDHEPLPIVGTERKRTISYVEAYPQIFMKKPTSDSFQRPPDPIFVPGVSPNNITDNEVDESVNSIQRVTDSMTSANNTFAVDESVFDPDNDSSGKKSIKYVPSDIESVATLFANNLQPTSSKLKKGLSKEKPTSSNVSLLKEKVNSKIEHDTITRMRSSEIKLRAITFQDSSTNIESNKDENNELHAKNNAQHSENTLQNTKKRTDDLDDKK